METIPRSSFYWSGSWLSKGWVSTRAHPPGKHIISRSLIGVCWAWASVQDWPVLYYPRTQQLIMLFSASKILSCSSDKPWCYSETMFWAWIPLVNFWVLGVRLYGNTIHIAYNLHTIQFTQLRCTVHRFLVYSQTLRIAPRSTLEYFWQSKKEILFPWVTLPNFSCSLSHSSSRQLLNLFLSLEICLCWTFQTNGISQCEDLAVSESTWSAQWPWGQEEFGFHSASKFTTCSHGQNPG